MLSLFHTLAVYYISSHMHVNISHTCMSLVTCSCRYHMHVLVTCHMYPYDMIRVMMTPSTRVVTNSTTTMGRTMVAIRSKFSTALIP